MKLLSLITLILFLLSIALIGFGFFTTADHKEKLIGSGVVLLFIFVFPLFSYIRWKDKDIKDYMLTKENLEKMRENQRDGKY